MCGIAGFCNLHRDKEQRERVIHAMTDHIRDRGPDDEGAAFFAFHAGEEVCDITFGHRRLAVIDLSDTGAQPMRSHSGRYSIVYNGEIYDHMILRRMLEEEYRVSPGSWRGTSDTESLLEAVESWGVAEALRRCHGMFAVALFDHETGRITLARDRVGEKPLYYGFVRGAGRDAEHPVFAFASDIGCLTKIPGFAGEIDRRVLPLYFVHGYIPAPYTIYRDIRKLEPGSMLTVEAPFAYFDPEEELDRLQRQSFSGDLPEDGTEEMPAGTGHRYGIWWSMAGAMRRGMREPFRGSFEEASQRLEELLTDAVERQMVADVPLGAFLSAGIDSSTIVSLMQTVARRDHAAPVRTFTIGMREEGFNEAPIAREIAAHLGTEHTELYITKDDALAVIPHLARMAGEPFGDSSQIPTYLVSKMTREHVTVSLSGDAGDELFCGYTSYFSVSRIWQKMQGIPAGLRRPASALLQRLPFVADNEVRRLKSRLLAARNPVELHRLESDYDALIDRIALPAGKGALPYKLTQLTESGRLWQPGEEAPYREPMLADLILYHPDDILVKVDRCAMAVSLESRVPLLDPDVVEFSWTLPVDYLVEQGTEGTAEKQRGKRILRDVLYRHVPRELMDRPKKGFSIPVPQWLLEEPLRSWAEKLLDPEKIRREGYLDSAIVERLWRDHTERGIWREQIWFILMFEEWLEEFHGQEG